MWEIWQGSEKRGEYKTLQETVEGLYRDTFGWSLAIVIEIREGVNRRVEYGYVFIKRINTKCL